ncbi:MAG: ABC transporter substrate-binding protein [Deltaproteobacteria bacterium]|nr:ABC transporter substrate-binding protein [Deltaproteobacteria bacterium]MBW2301711.1 ABC transporter substrate-binding protein [Deltaproteobacteria bacterium]
MERKSSYYRMVVFLATVILIVFLTPCLVTAGNSGVKIGLLVPLTGRAATIGQEVRDATLLAVDDINRGGGIKSLGGAKIKLIVADTGGKPEVGMSETERLIKSEHVIAIIGAYSSGVTFACTQISEKYKVPHLVNISVADKITERGFKYIFRISFKASWNAIANLKFAHWMGEITGKKAKRVVFLYEDSLWGQSTAKAWRKKAGEYGFEIVGDFPHPTNLMDVTGTVSKIKAVNPDIIFEIGVTPDAILITKTMREYDVYPNIARICSGGGHSDPKYFEAVGKAADCEFLNLMWSPLMKHPRIKDTNERHKNRFGYDMLDFSGFAYTAPWVLVDAINRAGSTDNEAIRKALSKTDLGIDDPGILLAFPIRFDETGQAPAEGCFAQWLKGVKEIIYPKKMATADPVWPAPKPW